MLLYIHNQSKLISEDEASRMTVAVARQMSTQVAPAYERLSPSISFIPAAGAVPKQANVITLLDEPDQDGVEGYHDLTSDGYVRGFVFAAPSMSNGAKVLEGPNSVASVLSHEVIEAFRDPWANYWVDTYGRLEIDGIAYAQVAMEACDPVESDEGNTILVDGIEVSVSNFILPSWENPNWKGETDFLSARDPAQNGKSTPFFRSEGGYVIVRNHIGAEVAKFGAKFPEWKKEFKMNKLNKLARSYRRIHKG